MSYFDRSDAEGVDFGDWVEEHEEERRELASLEAAGPYDPDEVDEDDGDSRLFCSQCGAEDSVRDDTCSSCGSFEPIGDDDMEALLYACGMCSRANVPVPDSLCAECKRFDAAHSGEGDDMDPDKLMEPLTDWRFEEYLKHASNPELKRARFAVDREQARRLEEARAAIRELDPNAPKPRATRRDKGTTRAPKENAA